MTVKQFWIYLISAFVLGFALMFGYHLINKPAPVIEIETKQDVRLKFQFDSLLTEHRISELKIVTLKQHSEEQQSKIDSLITNNQKNGKIKKNVLLNLSGNSVNNWNDSVLRANKLK